MKNLDAMKSYIREHNFTGLVKELVEDDDGCLIYAKDEHGDTLNFEIVECVGLPRLNTPIEEAIKMMAYSIINTAHNCY